MYSQNFSPHQIHGDVLVLFEGQQRLTWRAPNKGTAGVSSLWPNAAERQSVDRHLSRQAPLLIIIDRDISPVALLPEEVPNPSVAAFTGNPGQAAYTTSKAGLAGLALTVAQEYTSYNVGTVVVAPGVLDTGLGSALPPEHQQRLAGRSLSDQQGSGLKTAETIAYLSSPAARSINATVVHIDGGLRYP
ncbi:MAG: SDR family oxidoreductase [Streptomyces sp.]|uniref:SDR family oxidoreductase n=1 Tax=Streptomyces sp. TaxID=1931 RepID=UPI003D6A3269